MVSRTDLEFPAIGTGFVVNAIKLLKLEGLVNKSFSSDHVINGPLEISTVFAPATMANWDWDLPYYIPTE